MIFQVYVLKDSWRDQRLKPEGDLYAQIGLVEGVAEMFCHDVVHINGQVDSTAALIRDNLEVTEAPVYIDNVQSHGNAYGEGDFLPPIQSHKVNEMRPRDRIHSRLVMKTYGWSIKYAKSLSELVGAMRDAIAGITQTHERRSATDDIPRPP